jgi:xylan 1,4-beta-xylosidase
VYLTEWNSTVSHRDPLNDTCFKSAYIIKNLLENYDRITGFGYWLLSDYHDEFLQNRQLFHGGLGLFTVNGIPKPSYYAYVMLAHLGDTLVSQGKGWFITEQRGTYRILLYNYYHFNDAYAKEIGVNTTYTERSSVFPDKAKKIFNLSIPALKGKYVITHTYVNEHHGSVFNAFVRMGAVEPLSPDDVTYLASVSVPQIKKSVEEFDTGLSISTTLEPLEIRLIEIKPLV